MRIRATLALLSLLLSLLPSPAATLWQEGEAPVKSTMHRHPWWFDQVKKDLLSGGDWISNFAKEEGTADYQLEVTKAGNYVFWVRANPVGSHLSYALNDAAWTELKLDQDKRGEQNIAADGKPDLRFIAWIKVGNVTLAAGKQTVRFKMHGSENNHGGLDCFCFSDDGFTPQGLQKPGAKVASGPGDWFPLVMEEDTFSKDSVIDMSALVEAPAGKHGFVKASGDHLRFDSSPNPIKFWGVNANAEPGKLDRAGQQRRINYLRKFGINVVREHPLFDEISTKGKIDPAKLDEYDWWFAELKKAGIYTDWSVFYHFPISAADGYDPALFSELPDMKEGLRDTYGLITMSPELWRIRTKVMVALLEHKNPYTGLRYADDPALMAVEMQNEDSIFFWNPLGDLASEKPKQFPLHAKRLREKFAAWARERYKTDEALQEAWGNLNGESLSKRELALMGPWEIDSSGIRGRFAGQFKRAGDEIEFLTKHQESHYRLCEIAITKTGYRAQIITTNWLAGSPVMDQANIYTDTVGTMIDRHNYAGGGAGGHGIAEGQVFAGSHLGKPGQELFSIAFKQVEGKPFSMTEWTMCPPNQWKLEAAPIMAFYGMGLQGWDASYHFAQSGSGLGEGWPRMSSYVSDTPHYMGQFPALAFALAKGHIKEGPVMAARRTKSEGLFTGKQAWAQDFYNGKELIKTLGGTPLEMFAMGRVTVGFNEKPSEAVETHLLWDEKGKEVVSATAGELKWDYGQERILVKSPKTQAVIGKVAGATIKLPGVSAEFVTPFVSVIFTPLDDLPLAESKRILITALARDKQSGATYSEDGTKLLSMGTAPLMLEPVQAKLHFTGGKPKSVKSLDPNGMARPTSLLIEADGSFRIDGTHQAYYYEVRR
jgi:hypothetical protein